MPIALLQQLDTNTQMALWKLEEPPETLLQLLPQALEEPALRTPIPNTLLFRQRLASRAALLQLLPHQNLVLGKQGHKRTILVQPAKQLSISHAGNYVAVIISDDKKVGIDVEEVSPRIRNISQRFMNETEKSCLQHEEDDATMMLLWAAKEAVFKCEGNDELEFKTQICVQPFQRAQWGVLDVQVERTGQFFPVQVSYRFFEGYVLAHLVCQ